MPVKINGSTSGSVTLAAPATGSDVTLTLPGSAGTVPLLAGSNTWTGTQNFAGATLTGSGLDLISASSLSAVSSVNINNCFTSTYDNYFITFRATHSATQIEVNWRARVNGSDETSSNYNHRMLLASGTSVTTTSSTNQSAGVWCAISTNDVNVSAGWIFGPAQTRRTQTIAKGNYDNNIRDHNTDLNTGTAYDGITFFVSSGTMTGSLRIYGIRN